VKRDLGHRTADTPQARKKQRIGGGLLIAGIVINMVALLMPLNPGSRTLATALFGVGATFVAASVAYMIAARRSS
jgi:hypothetical protein